MPAERATAADLELFGSLRWHHAGEDRFIGDGYKVVRRMLEKRLPIDAILLTEHWLDRLAAPLQAYGASLRLAVASQEEMNAIVGFRLHQGVMALAPIPQPPPMRDVLRARPDPLLIALDGISNAENVGAVIRACAAFGADAVLCADSACSPWHRRAVRASMGAVLHLPTYHPLNLAQTIHVLDGVASYAAHIHGPTRDVREVDYSGPTCLVLGGEADGVSEPVLRACRERIYIPMDDGWDCLNVASAAAVLLYEATRRRTPTASRVI